MCEWRYPGGAPWSSESCPSQGCCPEPPVSPGSLECLRRVRTARTLTKIQMLSAAQRLGDSGVGRRRPGSGGGEPRHRPSLCSLRPPTLRWPPSSGREGVNLPASQRECGAINTHSQASLPEQPLESEGAGSTGSKRQAPAEAGAGARTPGARSFLGDGVGTVPASPGSRSPFSFRS